jgi:hypothetical protein
MISEADALQLQLRSLIAHWRTATHGLADLATFAAPDAWQQLETYLGLAVRRHLTEAGTAIMLELDAIEADLRFAQTAPQFQRVEQRVNKFKRRYLQVETVFEFYGHAVRARTTTRLAELLRAYDRLARQSMDALLVPLGIQPPPALVYIDAGLGASILRAGVRLWDGGSLSPAAAIKLTRFNIYRPTSMLHEAGHQVAHLTGWNDELRIALRQGIPDPLVARAWEGWATELGPDLIAFAHTGYGAVAALHDVVMGEAQQVFNYPFGDPHPIAFLRVLVGIQMCVRFFGAGPWDTLAQSWQATHRIAAAPADLQPLLAGSMQQLPRIVEIGLRTPMRSFGGRTLADLVNPARVSPLALERLGRDAGQALMTSHHWLRTEGLRILARHALLIATVPGRANELTTEYEDSMRRLGALTTSEQRLAA